MVLRNFMMDPLVHSVMEGAPSVVVVVELPQAPDDDPQRR